MSQIKVVITDDRGASESVTNSSSLTTPVSSTINTSNGSIKSQEVKQNQKSSKALATASVVASQAFNYMTSNIGKWTGSTRKQTAVNNMQQVVNTGAMFFINPMMAIVNVGMNIATTAMDTAFEQKWDANQKEYNRAKVGELKGMGH